MAWGAIRNRAPVPLLSRKTQIPCQDKSNLEDSFLVAPVISDWKWMQGFLTSVDQFEKNNLVSVKKIYSGSSFLSGIYELTPQHQCISQRHLEAFCSIRALPGREAKLLLQKQHAAILAQSFFPFPHCPERIEGCSLSLAPFAAVALTFKTRRGRALHAGWEKHQNYFCL